MRVLVFGTFDKLHCGHLHFLKEAQKRGDLFVIIGLDNTVKKIKGKRPTQNQEKRKETISKKFPNAQIIFGDNQDYLKPVRIINPDLILLGYDQKLPPGIKKKDIKCKIERLSAFEPEKYKSSLL